MAASARDLIAGLERNHRLMSEKEQLLSDIATLKQEVKDKQSKLRGVDESIAQNRESLLVRCSSTGPASLRRSAIVPPPGSRTTASSSTVASGANLAHRSAGRRANANVMQKVHVEDGSNLHQQVAKKSTSLVTLTEEATSIVEFEEGWAEISCHLCGANANRQTGAYFRGVSGLQKHLSKVHEQAHISMLDVISMCKRRYLEDVEVRAIGRGVRQIEKRLGVQNRDTSAINGDTPDNSAPVTDNDSDVVEIDPPVAKKEEHKDDAELMVAFQHSSPATAEYNSNIVPSPAAEQQATTQCLADSEQPKEDGIARTRSYSPLAMFKSGLLLSIVKKSGPCLARDLTQRKRKRATDDDGLDPFAHVRRKVDRAKSGTTAPKLRGLAPFRKVDRLETKSTATSTLHQLLYINFYQVPTPTGL